MTYLDSASTTKLDPEVIDTMIEYLSTQYGNPSSKYYPEAINAQKTLSTSRSQVAELLNIEPQHVVFTSGASESNNFIIKGVADLFSSRGKHLITTRIEHKSVLESFKYLESKGYEVTYLDVNQEGLIDLNHLKANLRSDTILISIMWVNNEIGTVMLTDDIINLCHQNKVLVHSDATQAVGKIKIDLAKTNVDFLSFSSHKLYGPKGIGAAIIGPDDLGLRFKITPLIHGGSQEFRMRGGTHAMHDIVGFAKACDLTKQHIKNNDQHILELELYLKEKLLNINPEISYIGSQSKKIPGILSIRIPRINNELFCKQYADQISISTGSACSIHEGSYVLDALDIPSSEVLRISISKFTNYNDIDIFLTLISKILP